MKQYLYNIAKGAALGGFLPEIAESMSRLEVTHYDICPERLPEEFDGLKIVQLSDLHNKKYGSGDAVLYDRIAACGPDLVFMTGDMISHRAENREDFIRLVQRLCRKYPVYYVNGNHEYSDMPPELFEQTAQELANAGAKCLDNSCVLLRRENAGLRLYGLSYHAKYYRGVRQYKLNWARFRVRDMRRCCGARPKDFTILLAHNPLDFDVHAEWGADLSFGGHIHGGVIRLPLVGGIISPELKLFPKYKEGVYKSGSSLLVVSRGLGRIRIFNPPELVSVTLKCRR